jgi:hypothetical protein
MYKYISVALAGENHIDDINEYASQGWRLVNILRYGTWGNNDINYIAYFEKFIYMLDKDGD